MLFSSNRLLYDVNVPFLSKVHNPPLVPIQSIPFLSINNVLISLFTILFSSLDVLYTVNLSVFLSYLFNPLSVAIQISLSIPIISC